MSPYDLPSRRALLGGAPKVTAADLQYSDTGDPAVLERRFDATSGVQGRVLLFTTPLV